MQKKGIFIFISLLLLSVIWFACSPSSVEPVKVGGIADNEFDPEEGGNVYPLEDEAWLKTKETKAADKSKYRRGWDTDRIIYDRLSEFPFAALLYNGWGFGIEYNEPRGHHFAIIDQIEVDPSRTSPGGVCLACKTPFHKSYTEKHGMKYLKAKFNDALDMFPKKLREMGPACIDCHQNDTMGLTTNKAHIEKGLAMIGKKEMTRQERRILACAQCHMTYYVPRDQKGKVAGDVIPPWTGSTWGDVSIEKITADLRSDYKRLEWKQKVTGFRMPYIRHPEFELFTRNSVHANAGLACPDCHMPYKRVGAHKISDHDVTSPLKTDLKACAQCHTESATWLKNQVIAIQDRTASLVIRAGYQTATTAKLFEQTHQARQAGKTINAALYRKAKDLYMRAFLRVVFISAENSMGFHNPTESTRVMGDAIAFSSKAEALLRQALTAAGVAVPQDINLELRKYLNGRGKKKLSFKREQLVPDPFDLQKILIPDSALGY